MTTTIAARPADDTPEIIAYAANELASTLIRCGDFKEEDREDIVKDLSEMIDDCPYEDGYEMGKWLEDNKYWKVHMSILESLDLAGCYVSDAHLDAVKKWVIENGIKPERAVGDRVMIHEGWKRTPVEGFIATVHEETARYTVRCPSLGHVEKGEGTHGFIIDYEKVFNPS
jgi:hypothetical protein